MVAVVVKCLAADRSVGPLDDDDESSLSPECVLFVASLPGSVRDVRSFVACVTVALCSTVCVSSPVAGPEQSTLFVVQ